MSDDQKERGGFLDQYPPTLTKAHMVVLLNIKRRTLNERMNTARKLNIWDDVPEPRIDKGQATIWSRPDVEQWLCRGESESHGPSGVGPRRTKR